MCHHVRRHSAAEQGLGDRCSRHTTCETATEKRAHSCQEASGRTRATGAHMRTAHMHDDITHMNGRTQATGARMTVHEAMHAWECTQHSRYVRAATGPDYPKEARSPYASRHGSGTGELRGRTYSLRECAVFMKCRTCVLSADIDKACPVCMCPCSWTSTRPWQPTLFAISLHLFTRCVVCFMLSVCAHAAGPWQGPGRKLHT